MSGSLSALLSMSSGEFYDMMETTIPATLEMEPVRMEEPGADALYGPGGYENIILTMES